MARDAKLENIIAGTLKALKGGKDAGDLAAFTSELFDGGSSDDLAAHGPKVLAAIATTAWARFSKHVPGHPDVSIETVKGAGDSSFIVIVNDDMPFLVDSILGLVNDRGHKPKFVLHPLYVLHRSAKGELEDLLASDGKVSGGAVRESVIVVEIGALAGKKARAELCDAIAAVLKDVHIVVCDWQSMMNRLRIAIEEFKDAPPPVVVDELAESIQFLEWLVDGNFIFLGLREYCFKGDPDKGELSAIEGSGQGILRDPKMHVLRRGRELVAITPEVRDFLMQPSPIIITKANVRATVHRRVHMDYIGVKNFDPAGTLTGELRVVGLYTSSAYNQSARRIPQLRRKLNEVVENSGLVPESHSGKALINVLETYPRDELFQIDVATLSRIAEGIRQLGERPRTRLFVRRDKFDRFVSCLVYISREQFNTTVRERIGALLADAYKGRLSAFYPDFPEGVLTRVHYIIGRDEGKTPEPDIARLEAQIADLALTWHERLANAAFATHDHARASHISTRYRGAFSAAYQEAFDAAQAIGDIDHIEKVLDNSAVAIAFYRRDGEDAFDLRLKLFHPGAPIALSDRLPILEAMGLRAVNERSYRIELPEPMAEHCVIWVHDIVLRSGVALEGDFAPLEKLLEDCFTAVWTGRAESDLYNSLALRARLPWRDIVILRAISKYLRQAGAPFSQRYMQQTLSKHARIAAMLSALFNARFDPAAKSGAEKRADGIVRKIETALADVDSLDEDRIVRRFLNIILASLRTNAFRPDKVFVDNGALAIKIRSRQVDGLPEPRPYAEIFVYSPDVEGVHLRGGPIARGGLRWSDRPEDFRTEVLGLVKAQQVKNAVIVPVGAKGGFVPHKLPVGGAREDILAEGIRSYKTFISSLLSVTDNLSGARTVHPDNVVRFDGDDPYLVVAADKGTATFSDIANSISEAHDFWLGDAFASGGSAGYDHKKMGITARGGWEAVKRHFREMDVDIQSSPFTVIGCGDMSGDVFGNGMLLSKQIRLLAAFDHRDIFIDPDPDPAKSFAERARLFKLERSSWKDYSEKLISRGGGIFPRSAKSLNLSAEIRALTGLKGATATPGELIRALLMAEADLLWFGGIGTYIRASTETDDDAGDRANDALRITAKQLNVKVIGEGANLGLTQRARIEFASRGGRVNNDAIDNSAGVNSSDVEVNIKIALGAVETAGKMTRKARNKLLAEMTEEVAGLVLRNNYRQTQTISLSEARGSEELGFQARLMRGLERRGLLDREIEFLPDDLALSEREAAGEALTRPEIAVLLAYAKLTLFDDLLATGLVDDPYLQGELMRYFPVRLQKDHPGAIKGHRLAREIIATMLANSMINRGGPCLVSALTDDTGADVKTVAAAFIVARESFDLLAVNDDVDALDNKIASDTQIGLFLRLQTLLRREINWFTANMDPGVALDDVISRYRSGIEGLKKDLADILPPDALKALAAARKALEEEKVPAALARRVAELDFLAHGPDIINVAARVDRPAADVARVYFMIGEKLKIDELIWSARRVAVEGYFDRLAVHRARAGLAESQRQLTAEILTVNGAAPDGKGEKAKGKKAKDGKAKDGKTRSKADKALDRWLTANGEQVSRAETRIGELMSAGDFNLARLTVANSYLRDLLAT